MSTIIKTITPANVPPDPMQFRAVCLTDGCTWNARSQYITWLEGVACDHVRGLRHTVNIEDTATVEAP